MKILEKTKNSKWKASVVFYLLACGLTYFFIHAPNLIKEIWRTLFNFSPNFSWNHGIALFVISILAYWFFNVDRKTTFLGNQPIFSLFSQLFF